MPYDLDAKDLSRTQLGVEVLDDPDECGRQAIGHEEKSDLAGCDLRVDLGPELVLVLDFRSP